MSNKGHSPERACESKGFTLIELLIAVSAVSIILVSLAAAATRSVGVQTQARQQAQATKLAEEQIERVRAFRDRNGFDSISCAANCYLPDVLTINTAEFVNGIFTIWLTISNADPLINCPSGNKYITATAQWGAAPDIHDSTVTTCLSEWSN